MSRHNNRWYQAFLPLKNYRCQILHLPLKTFLYLIWNAMLRGWFIHDKSRLKENNIKKHLFILNYLRKYIYKDYDFTIYNKDNSDYIVKEAPIWVCWLQGKNAMPQLNQLAFKSIKLHAGKHPVVFIDDQNISKYVIIPDYIYILFKRHKIIPAILADYIRVCLLDKYGGLWLDSTMFVTKDIPDEFFSYGFRSIKNICQDYSSISYYRWGTFILGSNRSNNVFKVIREAFERYFVINKKNIDYLLFDYIIDLVIESNNSFKKYIDNIPFSNPHMHDLREILNKEYDPVLYKRMISDTSFFKLTYKPYRFEKNKEGKLTTFGYMKFLINKLS